MGQAVRQNGEAGSAKAGENQRVKRDQRGELRLVPGAARSVRRTQLARAFHGAGDRGASIDTGIYG